MGGNPHNPGGRGLGEIPRAELEGRVLAAEGRAAEMLVAFRDLSERLRAEREARVAAEREWDEALEGLRLAGSDAVRHADARLRAEARVAALEAALQETAHTLHDLWRCNTDDERRALSGRVVIGMLYAAHPSNWAALGDQEAPTEPRFVWCIECDSTTVGVHQEGCEEAPTEPTDWEKHAQVALEAMADAAPQVAPEPEEMNDLSDGAEAAKKNVITAPEPERCPTCDGTAEWDWIAVPCPNPWHRPAPLVEEERPDA